MVLFLAAAGMTVQRVWWMERTDPLLSSMAHSCNYFKVGIHKPQRIMSLSTFLTYEVGAILGNRTVAFATELVCLHRVPNCELLLQPNNKRISSNAWM